MFRSWRRQSPSTSHGTRAIFVVATSRSVSWKRNTLKGQNGKLEGITVIATRSLAGIATSVMRGGHSKAVTDGRHPRAVPPSLGTSASPRTWGGLKGKQTIPPNSRFDFPADVTCYPVWLHFTRFLAIAFTPDLPSIPFCQNSPRGQCVDSPLNTIKLFPCKDRFYTGGSQSWSQSCPPPALSIYVKAVLDAHYPKTMWPTCSTETSPCPIFRQSNKRKHLPFCCIISSLSYHPRGSNNAKNPVGKFENEQ